ncbi:MAG: hypothetical protein ABI782_02675, partial [Anaerolineaceae bacterium]
MSDSDTDDLLIIDGDSHVLEPPDLWDRYLEPEFRPRAIRITRSIPLRDGEPRGIAPLAGPAAGRAPSEDAELNMPEMAWELKARLAADEHLIIDRQVIMSGGLAGLGGNGVPRANLPYMTYLEGAPLASFDTDERIKLFDSMGVHGGVVFPTIGILWDTDDLKLADAYSRAYNRWAYDFVGDHPDRIYPMAHISPHDPADA